MDGKLVDRLPFNANGPFSPVSVVAVSFRHEPSMIPKALKIATLQKKMPPIPPHTCDLIFMLPPHAIVGEAT